MWSKISFTLISIFVYLGIENMFNPIQTLILGKNAGNQLISSDQAYLQYSFIDSLFHGAGLVITLGLFFVLALIWVPYFLRNVKNFVDFTSAFIFGSLAMLPFFVPNQAKAYFDKTDYAEAITILPNESFFWIPDVGDNKNSQVKMDSADYLNANKVALKRFVIPHTKLNNSGGWGAWDYYVPTGRGIILDRSTFSREWVDANDRGTSVKKQGFPCQSSEGINITVGISIGATVTEDNAAKFLAKFGVSPPEGKRSDPATIFTSVYYAKSLTEVMDTIGRHKVQGVVCNEIAKRNFDAASKEATVIIDKVALDTKAYFEPFGVTIDFIGWGDTYTFDKEVQNAVNRRYVATQDQFMAQSLAPYTNVIKTLAEADALRAFGNKTDGKLPSTFTIVGFPTSVGGLMSNLFGSATEKAVVSK